MVLTVLLVHHSSNLLYTLTSQANAFLHPSDGHDHFQPHVREVELDHGGAKYIIFVCLIPILVLLSGVFAGLTLGYMSLDETQLNVLSISGTPQQRLYANKIKPIRKNGHLLLVTLLLANMIVNETLPVISAPVLGGGAQSVVVSTVLIVIFAEIIPQSVFTRHGLYLGAKMAGPTKVLIYGLGIISWPVAKLLEFALGPHHGIIYRRAELKELIAMHSHGALHGGDLKTDTVTIIGATLDLQEKVVKQAMTPIADVFMLSIDSKLDYELLKQICLTGHSRVPVYEEVEVLVEMHPGQTQPGIGAKGTKVKGDRTIKVKKIVGILLVKQCVLLDPKDAVPLRKIPLNKVPFVPNNEPLLGILDKFQEGRSHMAIVSRFSVDKAASVKQAVKRGLTKRLMERVGMGDSSDEEGDDVKRRKEKEKEKLVGEGDGDRDGESTLKGGSVLENFNNTDGHNDAARDKELTPRRRGRTKRWNSGRNDLEMGVLNDAKDTVDGDKGEGKEGKGRRTNFQLPVPNLNMSMVGLEQSMPADAVLAKEGAKEFLQSFDPAVMPLGIITLEDVLEELIGEEIYDEFDPQGAHAELSSYMPAPPSPPPPPPPPPPPHHDSTRTRPAASLSHQIAYALQHLSSGSLKPKDEAAQVKGKDDVDHVKPTDATKRKDDLRLMKGKDGLKVNNDASMAKLREDSTGEGTGVSKTGRTTPVVKPSANAPKGFDFLRSRSAPPRPREPRMDMSTAINISDKAENIRAGSDASAVDRIDGKKITGTPTTTSVVVGDELEASEANPTEGEPHENAQLAGQSTVLGSNAAGDVLTIRLPNTPFPAAASRGLSPAPSLEAILLDRKRRMNASSGTISSAGSSATLPAVASVATRVAMSNNAKGTMFKSSPLTGSERSGVFIAEKVREKMDVEGEEGNKVEEGSDKDL